MKTVVSLILILVSNLVVSQDSNADEFLKYPLKAIYKYCQDDSTEVISEQRFLYDDENRLIESNSFVGRPIEIRSRTLFQYDSSGLLTSETYYSLYPVEKPPSIKVFKYDANNRVDFEGYEDKTGIGNKTYHYNQDGLLVRSILDYGRKPIEYTYEYDDQARLIKKFENNNLKTFYEYSENKRYKEIKYARNGDTEILYEYDQNGLLITKTENGKVVERNIYADNYLVKRWTYYFGIDPCFLVCCSQYITTYTYY